MNLKGQFELLQFHADQSWSAAAEEKKNSKSATKPMDFDGVSPTT